MTHIATEISTPLTFSNIATIQYAYYHILAVLRSRTVAFLKTTLAAAAFCALLLFSGALHINSPAPVLEEFVREFETMEQLASRLVYHLDAPGAAVHIKRYLDALENLASRVERETRLQDFLRWSILAAVESEILRARLWYQRYGIPPVVP